MAAIPDWSALSGPRVLDELVGGGGDEECVGGVQAAEYW
jgi:hypothetical protein